MITFQSAKQSIMRIGQDESNDAPVRNTCLQRRALQETNLDQVSMTECTHQFLCDTNVGKDRNADTKNCEASPICFAELEDVLAILAEGGPLLDVNVLSNAHSPGHDEEE